MYLLFNKDLTLNTAIPHGDVPRQGGDLNLELFFPQDINLTKSTIWIRYRNVDKGQLHFSCDKLAVITSSQDSEDGTISLEEKEFKPISSDENYFGFEENKKYQYASVVYRACQCKDYPTKLFGNTDFVIEIINNDGTKVASKFSIYINETYGLTDDKTLGMTCSEYENLKQSITELITKFNTSKVGILWVGEYDEINGTIEIGYDKDVVNSMKYNKDTGVLTIGY